MKKIILVAGARPNFIKVAPLLKEFKKNNKFFEFLLVHTGQHYDFLMSKVFFTELSIPKPDIFLKVGSASHAVQSAKIMTKFEGLLLKERPDIVIVVGDVNSTLACSLVAAKMNIKVAHVESGLRSYDRTMPEEINRIVTDSISDFMFVSEKSGVINLRKEGVAKSKIFFVGNIMIDTLLSNWDKIQKSDILNRLKMSRKTYAVLTLHRPSNVDSLKTIAELYTVFSAISQNIKIIYPIHPRTKKMMSSLGYLKKFGKISNLIMTNPLGYIDFIKLISDSSFVLTDSGGIQEETTILRVPCLTMRNNTERPVTITEGTNKLVGRSKSVIIKEINRILTGQTTKKKNPKFWDGKTAKRIIDVLKRA